MAKAGKMTVPVEAQVTVNVVDMVDHPPHYTSHPKGIECIDVIEDMDAPNLANAMRYIWRVAFGGKWNDTEDLEKAIWYLRREVTRRKARKG